MYTRYGKSVIAGQLDRVPESPFRSGSWRLEIINNARVVGQGAWPTKQIESGVKSKRVPDTETGGRSAANNSQALKPSRG
jgi:protein subunit release factor A